MADKNKNKEGKKITMEVAIEPQLTYQGQYCIAKTINKARYADWCCRLAANAALIATPKRHESID